jgi:cell division septation protein DedD
MTDYSEDTEITLSTGKMLLIFFGLVVVCAVFFSLGYSLGKNSTKAAAVTTDPAVVSANTTKPGGESGAPSSDLSFYKAVESKEPDPEPKPEAKEEPKPAAEAPPVTTPAPKPAAGPMSAAAASTPAVASPSPVSGGYFVQVAAVTKQEDADALVGALKRKQYAAFAANNSATDKLYHVQIGPFASAKEAESLRAQLMKDGYSPILKK